MIVAQWVLVMGFGLRWIFAMYEAVNGREALRPSGFWGVFLSTLAVAGAVWVHWKAGALSMVLP